MSLVLMKTTEALDSNYCRILEDHYAPAMSLIPAPVVWQEDNAPSHNSKATRDWKKANFQYPELCWPPQSPDLAPMDYSIWQAVVSALPAERSSKVSAADTQTGRQTALT